MAPREKERGGGETLEFRSMMVKRYYYSRRRRSHLITRLIVRLPFTCTCSYRSGPSLEVTYDPPWSRSRYGSFTLYGHKRWKRSCSRNVITPLLHTRVMLLYALEVPIYRSICIKVFLKRLISARSRRSRFANDKQDVYRSQKCSLIDRWSNFRLEISIDHQSKPTKQDNLA